MQHKQLIYGRRINCREKKLLALVACSLLCVLVLVIALVKAHQSPNNWTQIHPSKFKLRFRKLWVPHIVNYDARVMNSGGGVGQAEEMDL